MSTVFTNANIFDGIKDEIAKDAWFLVDDDGKISETGTGAAPTASETVDLNGQYVMPGLINAHTHVSLDPNTHDGDGFADIVTVTVRSVEHLRQLLKSGVTYVRGCGSSYGVDRTLAKLQREGKLEKVPQIMPSGAPMTMSGGHGILFHGGNVTDSPDEMRKQVRENFADGAQCTKVMATGGVMSINDNMVQPQLKIPEIAVAVEETHSKGSIVAAHAEANPGIMNALKAKVDSIEHGDYLTDEEIQMMVDQGTYLTPTLLVVQSMVDHSDELPDWEAQKNAEVKEAGFRNFRKAYKAGVKLTLGTDAGCPFTNFDETPKEFEIMVDQLGMTNFDALSSSHNSATLMKLGEYGELAAGKYADFLVLKDNPLADVKAVQQEDKQVYQAGQRQF
ncbi:Imidazolonepropionase or related amidohydrolase (HutI) [Fructobacillus cardui]|uniref:metal-dependent hydrolase family protein n=1 Tax=Fructobacillus TaxID=559173 RepID=UPI00064D884E|nr:amidohydrolase family protein [Fructobacillus sp. EFB-N1]KMK52711.1 Imidazolonepropionase [Fructobacillus sp. EFB-N1]CAK1241668.1 Imidazolonepropionase or related amidohydrolase (HutI) [Fructobacillus cardui]CAK1245391.1 Imidazolonepropionase or related amidohydrolase (HutI) [Fructobacillus cardui]